MRQGLVEAAARRPEKGGPARSVVPDGLAAVRGLARARLPQDRHVAAPARREPERAAAELTGR